MALIGNTTDEKIWNYLKNKGLNEYACAGLMGNIYAESGLIPNRVEILCLKRLKENGKNYNDETYTAAIDSGKITKAEFLHPLPNKQYGYSLCQWTSPGRKEKLYDMAKSKGVSIGDLENALDFLWYELTHTYVNVLNSLKSATSIKEASDVVLKKFECPADVSSSVQETRASYGKKYYDKYANGGNVMAITAKQIIDVMQGWVGLDRAKGTHKPIIDLYNQYIKNHPGTGRGYLVSYTDAYCATTVSAAFIKLNAVDLVGSVECGVEEFIKIFKNKGIWNEDGNITPEPGYIICYNWDDTTQPNDGYADHIGIVKSVNKENKSIVVLEGNISGRVGTRTITVGYGCIRGYATPKYSKTNDSTQQTTSPTTTSKKLNEAVQWNGCVTANKLKVRSWAGKENKVCSFSPLSKNTVIGICDSLKDSNGLLWYFIKYEDKYGFVNSKYVKKLDSSSNDGNTKVESAQLFSKSIVGTYKVDQTLKLRVGAGINKNVVCKIPKNETVTCYGYYNKASSNIDWYYVAYKTFVGFVISTRLSKLSK